MGDDCASLYASELQAGAQQAPSSSRREVCAKYISFIGATIGEACPATCFECPAAELQPAPNTPPLPCAPVAPVAPDCSTAALGALTERHCPTAAAGAAVPTTCPLGCAGRFVGWWDLCGRSRDLAALDALVEGALSQFSATCIASLLRCGWAPSAPGGH